MDFNKLKTHMLSKPGVFEDFPFDTKTLVFKVAGKMIALVGLEDDPLRINLKCDPEHAEALRAMYPAVLPGYHMHKRHWNTVILDDSLPEDLLIEMVDDSYDLVFKSLTKAVQAELKP